MALTANSFDRDSTGAQVVDVATITGHRQQKVSPMDFWRNLARTANDPDSAYLQETGNSSGGEKSWWALTLAMLALFASMGGNLYMGWIAVDVYRRYLDAATDDYEDEDDDYESSERDVEDRWGRHHRRGREPVSARDRAVA